MDPQPNSRLTGYYDFRVAPLTFDFAIYLGILCGTSHEMRASSIALNLIVPWFRNSNFIEKDYMEGYREWKLLNVIMKMVSLVPAITDVAIVKQVPR